MEQKRIGARNDSALTALVRRETWELFCTLTFKKPEHYESVEATKKLLGDYLTRLAEKLRVPNTGWIWILRIERGGLTGRLHWHLLIGGIGPKLATRSAAYIAAAIWQRQMGIGIADARVFNSARDGVGYCMKGLNFEDANRYEAGKFAETDYTALFPAPLLVAKWRSESEPNRRRRRARDMRKSGHVKTDFGI